MPTTYTDQFFEINPAFPPSSGTSLVQLFLDMVDENDNGYISQNGGDSIDGSDITRGWPGDTITVEMDGSTVTITGITYYLADGRRLFTPTDGTNLDPATFISSTYVTTTGPATVTDLWPPCFAAGTMIRTVAGDVPIELLKVGDLIETMDHGAQQIRWVGCRTVSASGDFAPIRFEPDAIGNTRTLYLSPQHRVLFTDWRAELYFAEREILIAAKHLVNGKDITVQYGGQIEYFHLLFDQHEIIYSDNAPSESFHPGEQILSNDKALRAELSAIFPELSDEFGAKSWKTARTVAKSREAAILLHAV